MMPSRAGWAGGTRLMYYRVRKNQKATNRPYSGLWPLIIGKSVNPKCQTREYKLYNCHFKMSAQ